MGYTSATSHVAQTVTAYAGGPGQVAEALRLVSIELPYADLIAANVGVACYGPLPYAVRVKGAKLVPTRALTEDDTDYATVTLGSNDGAGGSVTSIVAVTTKKAASGGTGSWTAGTAIALTATPATTISEGAYVRAAVTKAGSGVVACFNLVLLGTQEG
jgi:hypothetical protein